MKLWLVTKLGKRNKTMLRKCDDGVIFTFCDVIVIFPIYSQFGLPDSGLIAVKLTFLLEVTFYLTKTENITEKSPTELSHYCFE